MESRFFELGRIGKARGLKGLVKVIPEGPAAEESLFEGNLLYMRNERGDWVPVRIESVHTEVKKQRTLFFVKFDRIATREEAEALMDHGLFTDQEPTLPEEASESSFIGYRVFSKGEEIGLVEDIVGSSMQQVLDIRLHQTGTSLLVPLVDEYVDQTDHQAKTIRCIHLDQLEEE